MDIIVKTKLAIRLDRYLRSLYPTITQGMIEKAIRKKDLKVKNKTGISASFRLYDGNMIYLYSGLVSSLPKIAAKKSTEKMQELSAIISQNIIFENDDFLAIDKPSGVASQGGTGIDVSLDEALKVINGEYRLTHRIDKETSGIIIVAKNKEASIRLTGAFKDQKIKKKYSATLVGIPKEDKGLIESYISKKSVSLNVQKVVEDKEEGRLAITEFEVIEKLDNNRCKVIFYPKTGRMHQLRFHSTQLGCYIEGDAKYGDVDPKSKVKLQLRAIYIKIPKKLFGYKEDIVIEA